MRARPESCSGRPARSNSRTTIVARADVIALRDRIKAAADEAIGEASADVTIRCSDGRRLHTLVRHAIGSLERPMTDADLQRKFHGLVDPVLGAARADAAGRCAGHAFGVRRSRRAHGAGARLGIMARPQRAASPDARRAIGMAVVAVTAPLSAQEFPQYGDELYRPRLRQPGKDVMWLPTPDAMVTRMLQAAKTSSDDLVYDLGAGDGRIPIAAAKEFGARAVGIEYDGELAALARRNAERAGVADKVTIVQGDIFSEDFSRATRRHAVPAARPQSAAAPADPRE